MRYTPLLSKSFSVFNQKQEWYDSRQECGLVLESNEGDVYVIRERGIVRWDFMESDFSGTLKHSRDET